MHPRSEAKCILKRNARAVKRWVKFTSRLRFSNFYFAEKPSQLKRRCHQNTPFSLSAFFTKLFSNESFLAVTGVAFDSVDTLSSFVTHSS